MLYLFFTVVIIEIQIMSQTSMCLISLLFDLIMLPRVLNSYFVSIHGSSPDSLFAGSLFLAAMSSSIKQSVRLFVCLFVLSLVSYTFFLTKCRCIVKGGT